MKTSLFSALMLGLCAVSAGAQTAPASSAPAQAAPGASLSQSTMGYYSAVKGWLMKAAADMSEADYGFRPQTAPAADKAQIRTFGQIIGHLADANYMFCSTASGMQDPAGAASIEKTRTTKADLQKALADSFAFCDKVWASTTDANAGAMVKFPQGVPLPPTTRLGALSINSAHEGEHYGNLVTYLRIKGMVPPSSQPMN